MSVISYFDDEMPNVWKWIISCIIIIIVTWFYHLLFIGIYTFLSETCLKEKVNLTYRSEKRNKRASEKHVHTLYEQERCL